MHLAFRITEAFHRNKKPNPSLISVYCTGGFSIGFNTQCCLTVVHCCTLFVTTMHRHFTHILLLKNDSTDFCCVWNSSSSLPSPQAWLVLPHYSGISYLTRDMLICQSFHCLLIKALPYNEIQVVIGDCDNNIRNIILICSMTFNWCSKKTRKNMVMYVVLHKAE